MTDWLELVGGIHSDLHLGTYNEPGWIDMAERHKILFVLNVGDIGQGGTVDLRVDEAQDVNGTGAAFVAGKSITQLTQAGGDGNDFVCIEVRTEEMNVAGGFSFLRPQLDCLVAASNAGLMVFAEPLRYSPPSLAQWTEVIP